MAINKRLTRQTDRTPVKPVKPGVAAAKAATDVILGKFPGPEAAAKFHNVKYRSYVQYYIDKYTANGTATALKAHAKDVGNVADESTCQHVSGGTFC